MTPIRWSYLKWIGRSPAHARYYLDNPIVETDAVRMGAAIHALVLKGEDFATFGGVRNGARWDEFQAANDDRTILTAKQAEHAHRIAEAITSRPDVMALLSGAVEKRMTWEIDGRECCGTPDVVAPSHLTDLKVTADASPRQFPWHARRMGWHAQLPWYAAGYEKTTGRLPEACYIVAVEAKPPYPVVIYKFSDTAFDTGWRTWRLYFEEFVGCERSGVWPGYALGTVPLDYPDAEEFTVTFEGEEVEL